MLHGIFVLKHTWITLFLQQHVWMDQHLVWRVAITLVGGEAAVAGPERVDPGGAGSRGDRGSAPASAGIR